MKHFTKYALFLLVFVVAAQANIPRLSPLYDVASNNYGARYYDPRTSVWQSPDPILGEYLAGRTNGGVFSPQNLHLYTYTRNNPVNLVDPDGMAPDPRLLGAGVGAAGAEDSTSHNYSAAETDAIFEKASILFGIGGIVKYFATDAIKSGIKNAAFKIKQQLAKKAKKKIIPNAAQQKNINRFHKKIPANAKENIKMYELPNRGIAVKATSPGKVRGSKAEYEKQIDINGKTMQYTKTTYDPSGSIVHVKDKINGGTLK